MKKNYVRPELDVVIFALESPILSNSQVIDPGAPGGKPRTNQYQGGWDQKQWTEN